MDPIERLEVKLATVRHVRDVGYWKLPYGTPIIAHPTLKAIKKAPIGSRADNSKKQMFVKIADDKWRSDKTGVVSTDADLISKYNASHLAPPTHGPAQTAQFGEPKKAKFTPKSASFRVGGKADTGMPRRKGFYKGERVQADQGEGTAAGGVVVKHEGDQVTVQHSNIGAPGTHEKTYHQSKIERQSDIDHRERVAKLKAEHATATATLKENSKVKGELSDEQYQAHADAIEKVLNKAIHDGESTDVKYRRFGIWKPERAEQHIDIINTLLEKATATAKQEHKMIIAGGLGGAGKSTVLGRHMGVDPKDWVTINPDDVKEEMAKRGMVPKVEGLSPMEASALIHEESGDIANAMLRAAEAQGYNIIQDITMSSIQTVDRRLNEAHEYGYKWVHGVFVNIPVETSVERALARHRRGMEAHRAGEGNGGRFVPPKIIRKSSHPEFGSVNRMAFEDRKKYFTSWQEWDNSGAGPKLIGKGGKKESGGNEQG